MKGRPLSEWIVAQNWSEPWVAKWCEAIEHEDWSVQEMSSWLAQDWHQRGFGFQVCVFVLHFYFSGAS